MTMTPDEYRNQLTVLTFPSGLQLAIKPPSVAKLMTLQRTILGGKKVTDAAYLDFLAQVMQEVGQGFPDGFTLDDLTDPQDWAYLEQYSLGFFPTMHFQGSALTQTPSGS